MEGPDTALWGRGAGGAVSCAPQKAPSRLTGTQPRARRWDRTSQGSHRAAASLHRRFTLVFSRGAHSANAALLTDVRVMVALPSFRRFWRLERRLAFPEHGSAGSGRRPGRGAGRGLGALRPCPACWGAATAAHAEQALLLQRENHKQGETAGPCFRFQCTFISVLYLFQASAYYMDIIHVGYQTLEHEEPV